MLIVSVLIVSVLIVSVLIVSVLIVSVLIVSVLIVSVLRGGPGGRRPERSKTKGSQTIFIFWGHKQKLFLQTQTEKAYAILRPPCSSRSR